MGSWFLNAGFLGLGTAALVSAPVIIHLINRYRFRRIEFAAMEFLLSSQQQNRRRILVEQLLLLLLRILLVMGLIALIARLVLDPSTLALLPGAAAARGQADSGARGARSMWCTHCTRGRAPSHRLGSAGKRSAPTPSLPPLHCRSAWARKGRGCAPARRRQAPARPR